MLLQREAWPFVPVFAGRKTGLRKFFTNISDPLRGLLRAGDDMALWKTLVSSLAGDAARSDGATFKPQDFRGPRRMREGYLWSESLIMPRPCTIRDMSPLTAQVVLWHDDIKPQVLARPLKLYVSSDRKEADCIVAGRDNNILSLRLTSAFRAPSRTYP